MIDYFVTYRTMRVNDHGVSENHGRCTIHMERPITGIGDVESIEDSIRARQDPGTEVLVMSWRRFEQD